MKVKTNHQNGLWAETLACWLLRLKGYRIIARRWRTPVGEIDILASRGRTLVIVEVKRRQTMEAALGCVTQSQRQRLERAMRYAVGGKPHYMNFSWRFDLLAVAPGRFPRHIVNAWEAS